MMVEMNAVPIATIEMRDRCESFDVAFNSFCERRLKGFSSDSPKNSAERDVLARS